MSLGDIDDTSSSYQRCNGSIRVYYRTTTISAHLLPCNISPMSMWLTLKPPREKPKEPRVSVVAATPTRVPVAEGISMSATAEAMKPKGRRMDERVGESGGVDSLGRVRCRGCRA